MLQYLILLTRLDSDNEDQKSTKSQLSYNQPDF